MSFSLSRSRVGTDSHIAAKLREAFGAYDRDGRGTMLGTQLADFDRRAFPPGHASAKRRIAKYGHEGSMSELTLDEFIAVEQPEIASLYADRKDEAIRLLKQIIADVRDQKAYTSSLRRQRSLSKLQARIGSLPKLRSVDRHPGDRETDSPSIGGDPQLLSLFHRPSATDPPVDSSALDAFSIITGKAPEGESSLNGSPARYSVASQSARGSLTEKRMSTRSRIQTVTASSLDEPPPHRLSPGFNIESPNGPSAQSARTSIVSINTATTVTLCDEPLSNVALERADTATATVSSMDGSLSLENPSLLKSVGPEQSSTALTEPKDSQSACCVIL